MKKAITKGSKTFAPLKRRLTRISHHLTAEARNRPAITSLRLLAVLNVGFKYARIVQKRLAERRAPCTDGPLTHFASPRGEKSGLVKLLLDGVAGELVRGRPPRHDDLADPSRGDQNDGAQ